jgi:hypothetical protein
MRLVSVSCNTMNYVFSDTYFKVYPKSKIQKQSFKRKVQALKKTSINIQQTIVNQILKPAY